MTTPWPKHWLHDRTHFFKYLSPQAAIAVLRSGGLRASSPTCLNDPFDLGFDLFIKRDEERIVHDAMDALWIAYSKGEFEPKNRLGEVLQWFRRKMPNRSRAEFEKHMKSGIEESLVKQRELLPEIQATLRAFVSDVKVLCLSAVPDNILMWSHYCANHTGVVLQLKCMPELDSIFGIAQQVRYQKDMPLLFDHEQTVKFLSGQFSLEESLTLNSVILTKAEDWAYEQEWRIVLHGSDTTREFEDLPFDRRELGAVYLGCRIAPQFKEEIVALLRGDYPGTKVYSANKSAREFKIEFTH